MQTKEQNMAVSDFHICNSESVKRFHKELRKALNKIQIEKPILIFTGDTWKSGREA